MEITRLDRVGLDFIKKEEGCILHSYKDSVGIPTIGFGQTYYPSNGQKVKMTDPPITLEKAESMFIEMLKPYELVVYSTTRNDLTQNQFNALVSLTYNIGTAGYKGSTVHRLVNANVIGLPLKDAFLMWCKAGGKLNLALKERRVREYNLYIS